MFNDLAVFIARKAAVGLLLLAFYLILDHGPLRAFHTAEVLQHDPKAIAGLLGAWALAIALA